MVSILERAYKLETEIAIAANQHSYDQAFQKCVDAVDLFMQARAQCVDVEDRKRISTKCKELMKRGEELKRLKNEAPYNEKDISRDVSNLSLKDGVQPMLPANGKATDTSTNKDSIALSNANKAKKPLFTKPPESKRELSKQELLLLLRSAKLAPHIFPPWNEDPQLSEFAASPDGKLFSDQGGFLTLSSIQQANFGHWQRIRDIWKGRETMSFRADGDKKVLDLSQDVITDCSIVASLCAALEREHRSTSAILTDKIWPQQHGKPILSPNGKYIVKLWFNGCWRKVVIDDFLPMAPDTSPHKLYVTVNHCESYLPPCLLEKAYLKAMGGYDFPGSNSGTDLLCFTGWIPEHLFLQPDVSDNNFDGSDPEGLWDRLYKAWDYGDVLVTLGTGKLENSEGAGLIGEHDYAVIGMKECMNRKGRLERWWLVKNPWKEGGVWIGQDDDSDDDSEEDWDHPQPKTPTQGSERLPDLFSKSTFWIDLPNVYRYFQSIYLNWNPALWQHRYDWHFSWNQPLPDKDNPSSVLSAEHLWHVPGCFLSNPQFSISNKENSESVVWILLSRHLVSSSDTTKNNRVGWTRSGYISLYLFANDGYRVYKTTGFIKRGPYVDSPQTLLRLTLPPRTTYTTVVSSQDLLPENASHTFTASAFSRTTITFEPAKDLYPHTAFVTGAWTTVTAGGNRESRDYEINPMFKISLDADFTDLVISLSVIETTQQPHLGANDSSAPYIQIALLHSNGGQRVYAITRQQIIADSGEYCRHFTICRARNVGRGTYTLVASTFKPDCMATFAITVGANQPLPAYSLVPLKSEDAGFYKRFIKGHWGTYKKMAHRIEASRLTRARIKCINAAGAGLIRLGVWEDKPYRWSAGGWNEDAEGEDAGFTGGVIRLSDIDLRPVKEVGDTWIVIQRMATDEGGLDGFDIVLLTDNGVEIIGGWVDVT